VDTSSTTGNKIFSSLGKWIDLNNYIKYHALTTLINNPDAFENNFFIMQESANSPYKFLPWDFDRCFERENDVGLYGNNAIIRKLFENDSTFNLYKTELENMLSTIYTNENTSNILDSYTDKIREAYEMDAYLGMAQSKGNLSMLAFKQKEHKRAIKQLFEILFLYTKMQSEEQVNHAFSVIQYLTKQLESNEVTEIFNSVNEELSKEGITWGKHAILSADDVKQIYSKLSQIKPNIKH